ncbi:MAG: translation initiation factor IF-2 [Candidatus Omnitrophota bacterium]
MRIHELAKELGLDSKKLIDQLKQLNFPVKSHMSSVDEETAEVIKHEIRDIEKKEIADNVVQADFPITVKDLAVKLNRKPSEILEKLIKQGRFYTINQNLDEENAREIALQYKVNLTKKLTEEESVLQVTAKDLRKRAPIVTLMGHIDHGKTSLLDYIRKSKITQKESGGITQHIGAYQVVSAKGSLTFLDTPGHETFTAMRARGANITDIVILVVAADEGVKPQTIEAIDHARAAGVQIIVAVNKIDKPNANMDMVRQELSKAGLVSEDWGGKTTTVGVSAKTGEGLDDLLDLIILQAELMDLKADYVRPAVGICVEARLSKGKGPVVSALIREGTLKLGSWCVCGMYWGKIKAMHDDRGRNVGEVCPSSPAEVIGLNGVPNPGDQFFVVPSEKSARDIVEKRRADHQKKKLSPPAHMKLEDLYKKIKDGRLKQLKIIIKADVGGTLEAVEDSLLKITSSEVSLLVIHKGVGAVNSSDVLLADVSDAIIVGFKVSADGHVRMLARQKGIELRIYQIVYELIDDVKAALEGMLAPQIKRTFLGRARVKTVFKLSKSGIIAGCIIEKGKVVRGSICQLLRNNSVVFEGSVKSVKRFKDDVKEATEGFECGIGIGFDAFEEGDIIDVFTEETITRRLK